MPPATDTRGLAPLTQAEKDAVIARIRAVPLARTLPLEIVTVERGECAFRLVRDPAYDGIFESLHGGILMTLADSAARAPRRRGMSEVDPAALEAVKARHRLTWGLDVDAYVKHTASEIGPVAERIVQIADPPWNGSVLDLGCGPGTATLPAAKRVGPGGRVVGIDLAPPMVAWAERAAEKLTITNATFQVGDAEDLSGFADGSFDRVISNFGVIFAPSPERAVAEAARVLVPGGSFVMSVWIPVGIVKETFDIMSSIAPPPTPGIFPPESWGERGEVDHRNAFALVGDAHSTMEGGGDGSGRSAAEIRKAVNDELWEIGRHLSTDEAVARWKTRRTHPDAP
jgi:SAM-dependent methyltransferase